MPTLVVKLFQKKAQIILAVKMANWFNVNQKNTFRTINTVLNFTMITCIV